MIRVFDFTSQAKEERKLSITDPESFLKNQFSLSYLPTIADTGIYRNAGWAYDFRPYLNRYVVCQYNNWQAYYCLNKTLLRKLIPGRVQEIVEIKKSIINQKNKLRMKKIK